LPLARQHLVWKPSPLVPPLCFGADFPGKTPLGCSFPPSGGCLLLSWTCYNARLGPHPLRYTTWLRLFFRFFVAVFVFPSFWIWLGTFGLASYDSLPWVRPFFLPRTGSSRLHPAERLGGVGPLFLLCVFFLNHWASPCRWGTPGTMPGFFPFTIFSSPNSLFLPSSFFCAPESVFPYAGLGWRAALAIPYAEGPLPLPKPPSLLFKGSFHILLVWAGLLSHVPFSAPRHCAYLGFSRLRDPVPISDWFFQDETPGAFLKSPRL